MCTHQNLIKQGYWVRCSDCGAASFGNKEEWITSSVQLYCLDEYAAELEKTIYKAKDLQKTLTCAWGQ